MRIEIHLFAAAAQLAQARAVLVELEPGATLDDVRAQLGATYPALMKLLDMSRWAVDHQFASLDTVITEHQEIAMIPPVSGG